MSSQSSSTDYILLLKQISKYLYAYGGPILMFVGIISCILSLIVFTKKDLRKNPCSIYFIAYNFTNLTLICLSISTVSFSIGYNIAPGTSYLSFCRYNLYMAILLDILSASYLVLASFDRMLVTSANSHTRQRSTRRFAYISILIITILWILFHSHILYSANINQIAPNTFVCSLPSGNHLIVHSYYSLIVKVFLIPSLLIIFGCLALNNIRRAHHRIIPASIVTNTGAIQRGQKQLSRAKDRQFALMMFIDISIYMIFSFMLSAILMYQQITQYNVKNSVQIQLDTFLKIVATFINYISMCIVCYTNILVSKTFRKSIKNIILCN
ncbi:hypothetical protein I4U23_011139 [Adineta vaga]|nr:hypothetical protein I4U23_011139 [Adineta vaga]